MKIHLKEASVNLDTKSRNFSQQSFSLSMLIKILKPDTKIMQIGVLALRKEERKLMHIVNSS